HLGPPESHRAGAPPEPFPRARPCSARPPEGGRLMCMVDDCEQSIVHTTTDRKARRQHKCCECGRAIEPGEHYRVVSGISSEHEPFRYKVCGHCAVAQDWLSDNCGGFVYTMLREDIEEHVDEYPRH